MLDSMGTVMGDHHYSDYMYNAYYRYGTLMTMIDCLALRYFLAFSIIAIYQTVTSTSFGAVGVDYATALYSTSLATTLYCTGVIVFRVVQIGRRSPAGPGLRSYRGVIEILVESSALYCIATLFALIAYIRSGPASEFASAFWTSITVSISFNVK